MLAQKALQQKGESLSSGLVRPINCVDATALYHDIWHILLCTSTVLKCITLESADTTGWTQYAVYRHSLDI